MSPVSLSPVSPPDDGRVVIRVAVPSGVDKDVAAQLLEDRYRRQIDVLEAERRRLLSEQGKLTREVIEAKDALIEQQDVRSLVDGLLSHLASEQRQRFVQSITVHSWGYMAIGDITNIVGDFRNTNINIKSRLERAMQAIGGMPESEASVKHELACLLEQLEAAVGAVPEQDSEDVQTVAAYTADIVEKSAAGEDPRLLAISAGAVLDKVRGYASQLSPVAKLVEQILGLLGLH